jgi:methylenetetrahydrofolate dehydrogenase (NADP+)/methenyltetrahydrofolate cyclohydrolase
LLNLVQRLNERPDIDGILVQMPLPKHIDTRRVLDAVHPAKDVDGFHPVNAGNLSIGLPGPRPCTPLGVMELLRRHGIEIAGKNAVIVGRSDIVGKPMAMLLLHANATVTICHSRTRDLAAECRRADILVGAIGRPAALTRECMKPGAVLIDVGINRVTDREQTGRIFAADPKKMAAFEKNGSVLVGDMHPGDAAEIGSYWTPVPGGVGPLTIAMLMVNTVESAERRLP